MIPIISIIIPTLNEVQFLEGTLKDLLSKAYDKQSVQIIVVDAGSIDGTLESIAEFNVIAFSKPEFKLKKYESLNFGIAKATGKYLLFLDADTILPEHFDLLIKEKLKDELCIGGAFEFSFENPDWRLRVIQLLNRIRYRFSQVYYGDQAVFCTKEATLSAGVFPKKKLMETAYFCNELMKFGKLSLIKSPVKTSPRRFLENGFFKVCWFDLMMWGRFFFDLSVDEYGEKYWSVNLKAK